MPRNPARFRPAVAPLEDRTNPAGGLDPTFAGGGVLLSQPAPLGSRPAVVALPDGDLVVSTSAGGDTRLTRYNADGTPDNAFGAGGRVDPLPGRDDSLTSLVPGPGGTLYLAGTEFVDFGSYTSNVSVVVRLKADGTLDSTFGDGGVARLPEGYEFEIAARPDGSVVAVGALPSLGTVAFQLTPAGQLDPAFGVGGRATIASQLGGSGPTTPPEMALTASGELVVAATSTRYTTDPATLTPLAFSTTAVYRLTPAGAPDPSFGGGDGVWLAGQDGPDLAGASALALQPDGKVVLAGTSAYDPARAADPATWWGTELVAVRLNADGTTDTGFGAGGSAVAVPAGGYAGYTSLGVLPDGRIVAASSRYTDKQVAVAVLNADGTPDTEFAPNSGGVLTVFPGSGGWLGATAGGLAISGNRIVVAGTITGDINYGPAGTGPITGQIGLAVLVTDAPPAEPTLPLPPEPPGESGGVIIIDPLPPPVFPATAGGTIDVAPTVALLSPPARPRVVGDLNGDRVADRVVTDGPRVSVLSGADGSVLIAPFAPFEAGYTGTLNAVLADLDGDGRAELAVAPELGGGPVVAVFRADGTPMARFFGIDDPAFRGGAHLAGGDFDRDGADDLAVSAGEGGGPRVAVFAGRGVGGDYRRLTNDFFAFEEAQRGGVNLAAGDLNGDGFAELVVGGGPGGGPRVTVLNGRDLAAGRRAVVTDDFAGDPQSRGGATVAVEGGFVTGTVGGSGARFVMRRAAGAATEPLGDPAFNGAFVG